MIHFEVKSKKLNLGKRKGQTVFYAKRKHYDRVSLKEVENEEKYIIFGLMYNIVEYVGATEKEFLQVHHEKWLKNMNERTKEEY